jgi:hypothetical protein
MASIRSVMNQEEKRAFLLETLEEMGLPDKLKQMFGQMLSSTFDMLLSPAQAIQANVLASTVLDKNMPSLVEKLVDHKMELLTDEEVEAMRAFNKSPIGRAITAKNAKDFAAGEALGAEWFKSIMPAIEEMLESFK